MGDELVDLSWFVSQTSSHYKKMGRRSDPFEVLCRPRHRSSELSLSYRLAVSESASANRRVLSARTVRAYMRGRRPSNPPRHAKGLHRDIKRAIPCFPDRGVAAVRPLGVFGEAGRLVGLLRFGAFGTPRPFQSLIGKSSCYAPTSQVLVRRATSIAEEPLHSSDLRAPSRAIHWFSVCSQGYSRCLPSDWLMRFSKKKK